MKGPRAQMSFFDRYRPMNPTVSTRSTSSAHTHICIAEKLLTGTAYDKWYEIPCSLLDKLEDMEESREAEQHNEDDGSDLRGIVSVQDVGVRVIESWMRLIIGHVDGRRVRCLSTDERIALGPVLCR